MPTDTDPRLPAARSVDSPTARTPAVYPGGTQVPYDVDVKWTAGTTDPAQRAAPALTADPDPDVEPYPAEWATTALSPLAQRLHGDCCDWGGDVEGHGGVDFELEATQERAKILGAALAAGEVVHPDTVKAPIEAKVSAGSLAGTIMTVVAAVAATILAHLGTFESLLGDSPWIGPLALLVGVAVNAAQTGAAYQAPHTPRPAGQVQR